MFPRAALCLRRRPAQTAPEIKGVMDGQFGAARHVWRTRAASVARLWTGAAAAAGLAGTAAF